MDCNEFRTNIASLSEGGAVDGAAAEHAGTCDTCRRSLERARLLVGTIRGFDRVVAPDSLDRRILSLPRPSRAPRALLRAAAAALLIVSAGFAAVLVTPSRPAYPRLNLKVIVESGNGEGEEEALREEIFGPESAILTADGGEASATGR